MGTFLEEFLGNLYCWFQSLYGVNLSEHLWGWEDATQAYTGPLVYNVVGFYTLIVSAIVVVLYYYVIDSPRFCKWWHWGIVAILNSVIALFLGYYRAYSDYNNGGIADSLMYLRDENGEVVDTLIGTSDCWGVGVVNMFVAFIFFFLLSLFLHWWSVNARYAPFVKF